MSSEQLAVQKVRHPIRLHLLEVKRVAELSPVMRRITLSDEDLHGFHSTSFDDHVKLLLPFEAVAPVNAPCAVTSVRRRPTLMNTLSKTAAA